MGQSDGKQTPEGDQLLPLSSNRTVHVSRFILGCISALISLFSFTGAVTGIVFYIARHRTGDANLASYLGSSLIWGLLGVATLYLAVRCFYSRPRA